MKRNILIKVSVILVFLFMSSFVLIDNTSNAGLLGNMNNKVSQFKQKGASGANIDTTNVVEPIKSLGQVLTYIGAGVMVAVVTYMGIKYVTSGPEAQAKLKGQLIGVIVSGCVIFGSYWIFLAVYNMVKGF